MKRYRYTTERVKEDRGYDLIRFTAEGEWGKFSEDNMLCVAEWCKEKHIGYRTSFDMISCHSPIHMEILQISFDGVKVGDFPEDIGSKKYSRNFHVKREYAKVNYNELVRKFGSPGKNWQIRSVNKVTVELSFDEAKDLTLAVLLWRQ